MARRYLDISELPPSEPVRPYRGSPQAQATAAARRGRDVHGASSSRHGLRHGGGHTDGHGSAHGAGRRRSGSYSITSTPEAHSADIGRRMMVYSIQMLLRVLCLIAFVLVDNWVLRIVFAAGVVVLPWSAVLLANVGADRTERSSSYAGPPRPRTAELAGGLGRDPQQAPEEFEGEYVDEQGSPLERQLGPGRPGAGEPGARGKPVDTAPGRMRDNRRRDHGARERGARADEVRGDEAWDDADGIVIDGQVREDPPSIAP